MELPQEVGELHYLEVLDLDGTEIITLPVAIGKLTNLTCLKVSFYGLAKLEALKLYLPEVVLLNDLRNSLSSLKHFRFTVGRHEQRIISRLPLEAAVKLEEEERCLKYVNGECNEIQTIVDAGNGGDVLLGITKVFESSLYEEFKEHLEGPTLSRFSIQSEIFGVVYLSPVDYHFYIEFAKKSPQFRGACGRRLP
ncbi:hypothetical protein CK203_093332 [Vitis vinifera]|uniref:Disease resistance R13L4/SHOC-2-like LRR domain-containing protein n=1 Tax=Vitis vinifera TaxID=29760 RepID=A0A438E2Z5_VITVI|nr:hypothetical protein CK203_093332 [Vitis vinifera]